MSTWEVVDRFENSNDEHKCQEGRPCVYYKQTNKRTNSKENKEKKKRLKWKINRLAIFFMQYFFYADENFHHNLQF